MLRSLQINNLILVEQADVHLHSALNMITGETGAGKTALLHALTLVVGAKCDPSLIRHGADRCTVEASFELQEDHPLIQLLSEAGIDHEAGEPLIIKREMDRQGKSKAFINQQAVQKKFLGKVGEQLVTIVSQHSTRELLERETHQELLDLFAGIEGDVFQLEKVWSERQRKLKELQDFDKEEREREREASRLREECAEIAAAKLDGEDEESLYNLYCRLSNAEELKKKLHAITGLLSHEEKSSLSLLLRAKKELIEAAAIDAELNPELHAMQGAILELEEVERTLTRYIETLDIDPQELELLNSRIKTIEKLKKKYGPQLQDVVRYSLEAEKKLNSYVEATHTKEELSDAISQLNEKVSDLSAKISLAREKASIPFAKMIESELSELNMKGATISIELSKKPTGPAGSEEIEFFIAPNKGEHKVPLRTAASGGELSRLLLAIKSILAGREQPQLLVFDEIDGNIGGKTAEKVGKKLLSLSANYQLLTITHFAQTAKHAHRHFKVEKMERDGRTISLITPLDEKARKDEFLRMQGV